MHQNISFMPYTQKKKTVTHAHTLHTFLSPCIYTIKYIYVYVYIYIFLFATEKVLYKSFSSLLYVLFSCRMLCRMKALSMLLFLIVMNIFGNSEKHYRIQY
jgi:hypothetical protein